MTSTTSKAAHHTHASLFLRVLTAVGNFFLALLTVMCRKIFGEYKEATVERVTVEIKDLPDELNRLSIVFLSDFHYNGTDHVLHGVNKALLNDAVSKAMALRPDLVLLGGDFINKEGDCAEPFADLWLRKLVMCSAHGAYAVLGNHDQCAPGAREAVVAALAQAGVHLLDNASCSPIPGLELVGVGDWLTKGDAHPEKAFPSRKCAPSACRVVLAHNPDCVPDNVRDGGCADLQISGHTHGGQICLGPVGPLIPWVASHLLFLGFLVRKISHSVVNWEWASGLHRVPDTGNLDNDMWLYVSRGVGSHPPLRLCCPPEVTQITLKKKKKKRAHKKAK